MTDFAGRAKHPELASAPLLLWGMSAGGEFNYEFAAWKPERVVAFIVNKGNVYYTALASRPRAAVPALLFIGENDLEFRNHTIVGLFALNRRAGRALGADAGAGHRPRGRTIARPGRDLFRRHACAPSARHARGGHDSTHAAVDKEGFLGDLKARTFQPVGDSKPPHAPTAWLPTARVAGAWQAVINGTPFEK